EGFATLQIDQQVRAKAPRVFRGFAFLRDASYRLAADERDGRDIVRATVVVQQEELSARARLECLAEFVALNGELLSTRGGDRHLDFLRAGSLHASAVAKQFRQLPGSEPGKGAARGRLDERVAPVRQYTPAESASRWPRTRRAST